MRKLLFLSVILLLPVFAAASGSDMKLLEPAIDLKDSTSLQRGARLFVNYCLSCHNASLMRYNRMGLDIGLTDDQIKNNMMFATDKVGDTMKVAMSSEDAAMWFGTQPPDLSVVSRSRGVEWLYSYLLGFYKDANPSRPFGVNNVVFRDVGMPHVLLGLQGVQERKLSDAEADQHHVSQGMGDLELVQPGFMDASEYRNAVADLVAFLAYIGEPAKLQRQELGLWVLVFLALLFGFAYFLKREYWKDIH
uniref:Ubiquinol-cytochrome c reductase cytochrome c1 subunit n=1 Tax=Candidatus Kentrum sp. TUN TaxID=2126343 RepID=A0A451ADF4_9GAMM|nr:MAG: ubiquinol-cytochrome c reductase cytochrome c1 subunit [Candidatus Kentron sp. TUN]